MIFDPRHIATAMGIFCGTAVVIAGFLLPQVSRSQQSFSCPALGQPACIDWDEKVVKKSYDCFDLYRCRGEDVVCASEMDELRRKYNTLAEDYREYVDAGRTCANEFLEMEQKKIELESKLKDMGARYAKVGLCLDTSETLEEARKCLK